MTQRQRGLRHELSAILGVDPITQEFRPWHLQPPVEQIATRLANLIAHAIEQHDEARIIYTFLPALMLRVFGYEVGQGWLEICSEQPSRDRDAIVALALPGGPIHRFCERHSPKRTDDDEDDDDDDYDSNMSFEFPRRNLPEGTDAALGGSEFSSSCTVSYLAPLLSRSLRGSEDRNLFLSPLDYFYMCMVASPTRKCVSLRGPNSSAKMPKRSRSLPSVRAQYNQVIAAYASQFKGSSKVNTESIFIPACLDFLFLPWAQATPENVPGISTSTADAVSSLLLTLAPESPAVLDLELNGRSDDMGSSERLKLLSNTSALYRETGKMLTGVFTNFGNSTSLFPLIAYTRVLAIYIAPWRGSVHAALKSMLFPKTKPRSNTNSSRSPSISAFSSTLSSINAHLPSPSGSPTNVTPVKETQWRSDLRDRQQHVDRGLLRRVVVLAATHRVATIPDGARALSLVAEASNAARLSSASPVTPNAEEMEELQLCLSAMREHKAQMERRSGRKEKNFVSLFAVNLGVKGERGSMLSGFTDMVHAGSTNGMAGVVNMVSHGRSSTPGSLSKRKRQERRTSAICGMLPDEVPFLGSVWDRPIAHGESETLVIMAYWLALRLEPAFGYVPDTRFLGQCWVWVMVSLLFATCLGIKQLLFSFTH